MPRFVKCGACSTWQRHGDQPASLFQCSSCRQQIVVALADTKEGNWVVCDRCSKRIWQVPAGHIGDVEVNCPTCGTRRLNAATSAAVVTLGDFGSMVMQFKQGELIDKHFKAELVSKLGISRGICEGVCVHWVRRQLLANKSDQHLFKAEKLDQALVKGATIHVLSRAAEEGSRRPWNEVAKEVDERRLAKKSTARKLLKDLDQFSSGRAEGVEVKTYTEKTCQRSEFERGQCALFTCSVSPNGKGHTVAIQKRHDGYFLFDPNYGVYDVKSVDRLGDALHWAFCEDSVGIKATNKTRELEHRLFRKASGVAMSSAQRD